MGVAISTQSGFGGILDNAGSMLNEGVEFELYSNNLVGDFNWNTNFTLSSNRNEIPSFWDQTYHGINEANTLIDKLPDANVSSNVKARIEGQAKFLRAFFYFNLVRIFGGVPLEIQGTFDLSDIDKPRIICHILP